MKNTKNKIFVGVALFICILSVVIFLVINRKNEKVSDIEISFFMNINPERSFWVGDILRFYDKKGKLLARLSKPVIVQSAETSNFNTLSFDLIDNAFYKTPLRREQFIDLGRPAKNNAYLSFVDNHLVAFSNSSGQSYCKTNLNSIHWKLCNYTRGRTYLRNIKKFVDAEVKYINSILLIGFNTVLAVNDYGFLFRCDSFGTTNFYCKKIKLKEKIKQIYTYAVKGDLVSLYSSDSNIYTLNMKDNIIQKSYYEPLSVKISNQFYTSFLIDGVIYLGHYPSGGFLKKEVSSESLTCRPPKQKHHGLLARELQSIGYIGGKFVIGMWPWGEVWEALAEEKEIDFRHVIKMFKDREHEEDQKIHPFEHALSKPYASNELGRRITSIVPCWNGLCVATGSKRIDIKESDLIKNNINPDILEEYGRVYYLPGPKSTCSVDDVSGKHFFELQISKNKAVLKMDKKEISRFHFDKYDAEKIIRNANRVEILSSYAEKNGHYGQIHSFLN